MKRRTMIGTAEIREAARMLESFRRAAAQRERQMREDEEWFTLRVRPSAAKNTQGEEFAPTSAWLLNTVLQKHADMMDKLPEAVCLAREPADEADAKALSEILPVILEQGEFDARYSDNLWTKLKHGYAAWGVFWNKELHHGVGDIDVRSVDPMHLYFEPGVRDIQDSRAVFYTQSMELSDVITRHPHAPVCDLCAIEGSAGRVLVVDWYYKKTDPYGRRVLHYCKFSGDVVLFSTENDPNFSGGLYAHGLYPFVLDVMYPIAGECTGFGLIALAKNPQIYIDRMDRNLMEYMDWATRVRYFCKKNTGINEREFSDVTRRVVEVEGDLGEERLRQITAEPLDEIWLRLKNAKVDEIKETTFNRNLLQGQSENGVTAASAIAALQEAGGKGVRDLVSGSYRAFVKIVRLVIECVRQFYDGERYFRICTENGYRYRTYSGERIRAKRAGYLEDGTVLLRMPTFDIDVRARETDAYTRLAQNDNLKELYRLGIFAEENREAAMLLLEAMDFPGCRRLLTALKEKKTANVMQNTARSVKAQEAAGESEGKPARGLEVGA